MIVDLFIWSYEREAVDIRLKNLMGIVDVSVAVQATNTFRGELREVKLMDTFGVIDVVVTIPAGLDPWASEKWIREEALRKAVELYGEDAWYMISDGDEIPRPEAIVDAVLGGQPMILPTDYRNWYADWRAVDHKLEHQPTIGKPEHYAAAGGACEARWHVQWAWSESWGWHLSSLGGNDLIKQKLSTFSHSEYDTEEVRSNLDNARAEMKDFLGRFELEHTTDIPKGVPDHLLGGRRA